MLDDEHAQERELEGVDEREQRRCPTPASAGPATSSQSPRRVSKRCPKSGWTTDEATVAASMMAAVRVYERCSSVRRNGSSAGHAALREIGRPGGRS